MLPPLFLSASDVESMQEDSTEESALKEGAEANLRKSEPVIDTSSKYSEEENQAAISGLQTLAMELNPTVGFWDPLGLASSDFTSLGVPFSVNFLRQAEVKHGRVAMAAFVGYCVQASGVRFPFVPMSESFPSPEAQWDALPTTIKWQIILTVGLLEFLDEVDGEVDPETGVFAVNHWAYGGRAPGSHPLFKRRNNNKKQIDEQKMTKRQCKEINNGRLAMLGIMGSISAASVPGSIPLLKNVPSYSGNIWAPFEAEGGLWQATATVNMVDTAVP